MIEVYNTNDYEILTDNGWESFEGIGVTDKLKTIMIKTTSNFVLNASEKHIIFDENKKEILVKDLKLNNSIVTINGIEQIKEIKINEITENLYDILDVENSKYYTNNILSHNCGKSTCVELITCHYILFNKDKNVALLANKAANSIDLLRKIKLAYELLPRWMQHGVKVWNEKIIRLENGCCVMAASSSASSIRSKSINLLILDEVSSILPNSWEKFYSSTYPTISSSKSSKVIMISTPLGMNHFYRLWKDAINNRNNYKPIRVDWWQVPGRDENWKQETIDNIGQRRFDEEFGNEFQGSAKTLIEGPYLRKFEYKDPIADHPFVGRLPENIRPHLSIYANPIPDRSYSLAIDPSRMTEESNSDSLAMQVLDISTLPFKQVATFYADKGISYLQIPNIANELGKFYNNAYCFVENNDIGQEVANIMANDLEYENMYFEKGGLPGYKTTKKTKRLGCNNLKTLIEKKMLEVVDYKTIAELSTFVNKNDTYCAEKGCRDDAVMSMIGTLFFMQIPGFDGLPEKEDFIKRVFSKELMDNEMMEEVPAFGGMGHVDVDEDPDPFKFFFS